MKRDFARETAAALNQAFAEKAFLRTLTMRQSEVRRAVRSVDWRAAVRSLLPIKERLTCAQVLELCRPMLDAVSPEPEEGWLRCAYQVVCALQFPRMAGSHTAAQRDAALLYLQALQVLLDAERRLLPFDPLTDFAFCTDDELTGSMVENEYRTFLAAFRTGFVYEMLRLSREATPFRTLDHIAGVHHVSMTVARSFAARGGLVDLALISGAAAGHDLGKFGCRPGERVPYLHYHYTNQWFTQRRLENIGHIAANHSVWDLELENLSAESLMLVYADFRVKQERGSAGEEICRIYSLTDAFDVILSKLDNVDAAKTRRYRFVYAKLKDFEEYLRSFGADLELSGTAEPLPRKDPALLTPDEVVEQLRRTAVDHNIRLMHRLSHDQLFASVLEAAKSEKTWSRLRAYISVFEEYFTYLSSSQKVQTLDFLYEQLLNPDGDIRRQAATLIGRILARFHSGYQKELPADAAPDPELDLPFRLWAEYLEKIIRPDRRLTPPQISKIRYTAKLVVDAALADCDADDAPRFLQELLRHYQRPEEADDAAFALMDTVVNLPSRYCDADTVALLERFASHWLTAGDLPQKAAALYLCSHLLKLGADEAVRSRMTAHLAAADVADSTPLLFLQANLCRSLGMDVSRQERLLDDPGAVSNVFLDNLKTATPWILKALGVEYLLSQVERDNGQNTLHIATHFSNLIKVSEHVVVRRMAGKALLKLAPALTPDRRNEIAVELSKALETGQSDLSKYIPDYLGRFILWLTPRELDEVIDQTEQLLSSPSTNVVSAALSTVGSTLEYYAEYADRFREAPETNERRRRRLAGLLLKGLAAPRGPVQQESLRILGEALFASDVLSYADKTALFTLCAKKILCLVPESGEQELTFFYTASALSHLYRFIVLHHIEDGPFRFTIPEKAAFFPGTFDPFSLSHKGIVQAIRALGFEVYLAVDEFSWSKKAQPGLIRRQLVSMSVADEFDVYLFPHDIPVNLANPENLNDLRRVFGSRPLYLAVGSDVVANASSYKAAPTPGSVHHMNHIVFRRASLEDGHETETDLTCILGDVLRLQLATHLEDISSTRIRENIDMGRDISNLIDPTVQDYIYRNSLYLREPQYKRLLRTGDLEFHCLQPGETAPRQEAAEAIAAVTGRPLTVDPRDTVVILRDIDGPVYVLGALTMRTVTSVGLYDALGDADAADYIRDHSAGRICLITGVHTVPPSAASTAVSNTDISQMLLTESLFHALGDDCSYAVFAPGETQSGEVTELMLRSGFLPTPGSVSARPLMLTDMRSPVALIQNLATTLKAPFNADPTVLAVIRKAHHRFQQSVATLYPGTAVLSLNAELIHHRLVRRIVELNGVPAEPTVPRVLGEKMCVPFGKILRGDAVPNTVTKTIHTDKVFAPDLRSFTIEAFPGYAPLESQIRTIKSFRREVILVDDLLHSGARMQALYPLLRKHDVPVDRVLVGMMSGRGRDLMAHRGIAADCVYFIPNLRSWFVESTMYPFIGGDAVADAVPSVPGLTPALNLIMPYAYPRFYSECGREAVTRFSRTCLENSRDILLALESAYRARYARNLTLSRLSEAVILPLSPDKGAAMRYDPNLTASACLESDLLLLTRMQDAMG